MEQVLVGRRYYYEHKAGQIAKQVNKHLNSKNFEGGDVNTYRKAKIIPEFLVRERGNSPRLFTAEATEWFLLGREIYKSAKQTTLENVGRVFELTIEKVMNGETLPSRDTPEFAERMESLREKIAECFEVDENYVHFLQRLIDQMGVAIPPEFLLD